MSCGFKDGSLCYNGDDSLCYNGGRFVDLIIHERILTWVRQVENHPKKCPLSDCVDQNTEEQLLHQATTQWAVIWCFVLLKKCLKKSEAT